MISNGTKAYRWDRINRLLLMGDHNCEYYVYSNNISQNVNNIVMHYLLDVQPDLVRGIAATTDETDTAHYIYVLRGIHAVQNATDDWR